jgi:CRISPR-associated protein Csm1
VSVQIFLQGKLTGVAEFLGAPIAHPEPDEVFTGRAHWVSLLSEVLPRAVLAELGLARILLGSSGGGQFLLVLPEESRGRAEEILQAAAAEVVALSGSRLRLIWACTENLGDWTDIRKRLQDRLRERRGAPGYAADAEDVPADEWFAREAGSRLREIEGIGWSPETPGRVLAEGGAHRWPVGSQADAIPFARHAALRAGGDGLATVAELAARAEGRAGWGVLRGDVDHFGVRFRRVTTIEEHIQLSVLYKQFFAGEIEVLASMPEFWRNVRCCIRAATISRCTAPGTR